MSNYFKRQIRATMRSFGGSLVVMGVILWLSFGIGLELFLAICGACVLTSSFLIRDND